MSWGSSYHQSNSGYQNHYNNHSNNVEVTNNDTIYPHSDSEAVYGSYGSIDHYDYDDRVLSDDDTESKSVFNGLDATNRNLYLNRTVLTGRQRKKIAARSKGGEFQNRRRKKRVYFCCVSSEIDVQKFYDSLVIDKTMLSEWTPTIQSEVLRLQKMKTVTNDSSKDRKRSFHESSPTTNLHNSNRILVSKSLDSQTYINHNDSNRENPISYHTYQADYEAVKENGNFNIELIGSQEVFIFDFGAVVLWGFIPGEELELLKVIRKFSVRRLVGSNEFEFGEDDMAFITATTDKIAIANDMITLPENSVSTQRLAVSYAIAQSSVLSIFEARIDRTVVEYKYIPEALAATGKIHLTQKRLGTMIGDIFVIQHDVNLHTEILDTPDFFWTNEMYLRDYRLVMNYLEMNSRTEILNKRVDLLRELLDVLQQQMESAHTIKLEWIVIYLIIAGIVMDLLAIYFSEFK